jgi:hypothetical protein
MQVNDPKVIAELAELYPKYETALVTNDVDTLIAMFWESAEVVRYGVTENLHGYAQILAFRKERAPMNLARTIERLDIVSFGNDFGCVTLEFSRQANGVTMHGRQSQSWVRMPEGWRIVSAHVSLLRVPVTRSA